MQAPWIRNDDMIVTCTYCREQIYFSSSYVIRNGSMPDTYECEDELACQALAAQRGYIGPVVLNPDVRY